MSRLAVRQQFETELVTFLATLPVPVPFYNTINEEQDPTDQVWVTVEYVEGFMEPHCYGDKARMIESTIEVDVFVRPGNGYQAAVEIADAIESHFLYRDLGAGVEITDAVSAGELTQGDGSPAWYGVNVALTCQYYL